jgi:hypothetical protein
VSLMCPVALPTWKQSLHPLNRRPGGLLGVSGRLEKRNLSFFLRRNPTSVPRSSSPHASHNTDCFTPIPGC